MDNAVQPDLDGLESHLPTFGLSSFRPGQRDVIETVMAGRDCLCVMPTGGGKSLCYQLPAIARAGVTLVISPLIALMKDQVDALTARGLSAAFINSTLTPDELNERLSGMVSGKYRLMYVVPERFRSPRFVEAVRNSNLRFLAVDEAHCVSEWGHDFRPDYARLGQFRQQLGNPPTLALTATATDRVRGDIAQLLNLRDPQIFVTGFERPNLFYEVAVCPSDRDKDETLFRFLADTPGAGIVYASTRKRCEELGERIATRAGRKTTVYHAGLAAQDRRQAQDDFIQGRTEIAVATLAFGMGIDKSNVRFVVHYNLPGSLEAYYQEAGRAGRDGQPARCLLLLGGADRRIHEFFIESAYPSRHVVEQVYDFLRAQPRDTVEMTQREVKEALGLSIGTEGIGTCEKMFEAAGVLERLEATENTAAMRIASDLPTLLDLLPRQAKVKRQVMRAIEERVGGDRHQWCYFQPRELLRALPDMDSRHLAGHLRELSSLAAFDYVPPFQGRAIHLCERGRTFQSLQIDFAGLDRRKQHEYERLERVVRFANSSTCRQAEIVNYFGQSDTGPCGHCDNCQNVTTPRDGGAARDASPRAIEVARIVLSGVARMAQRRRECGKQLLAQMLCGSNSKAVSRNRLDKLSTFGLLSTFTQPDVVNLVDALLAASLLEQTELEPFRPILRLTESGSRVMAGHDADALRLSLPAALWKKLDNAAPPGADVEEQPAGDARLLSALRAWREQTCRSKKVPAYLVLNNAALEELARYQPQTSEELLAVKGIGPQKVREYGAELLAILGASPQPDAVAPVARAEVTFEPDTTALDAVHLTDDVDAIANEAFDAVDFEPPADESLQTVPVEPDRDDALLKAAESAESLMSDPRARPSHYWTWRLLVDGFTSEECAAIRSLSADVVLDHVLRAADCGLEVDPAWLLTPELIAKIERLIPSGESVRIRSLLAHLPRGTRYEEVQLVLKSRRAPEVTS